VSFHRWWQFWLANLGMIVACVAMGLRLAGDQGALEGWLVNADLRACEFEERPGSPGRSERLGGVGGPFRAKPTSSDQAGVAQALRAAAS